MKIEFIECIALCLYTVKKHRTFYCRYGNDMSLDLHLTHTSKHDLTCRLNDLHGMLSSSEWSVH